MDGGYFDKEIDILEWKVVDKNCHTMKTDVQNILTPVVKYKTLNSNSEELDIKEHTNLFLSKNHNDRISDVKT